jgi:lipopolysaccharide export system ATP-binding protein
VSIDDEFIRLGCVNNRIAYLPQHNYLPMAIRVKHLAKMLIDEAFWDEFADHAVYQKSFNKTMGQLSGGEVRMLEMLMVVYNKAGFILLDEPFTHISPIQTEYFKPVIKSAAKRKGIIVTDHQYYNVLDVSDRLIILEDGCTKTINSIDELVTYRYLSGIN